MAVATDTLGRVMLLDVAAMAIVRLWKVLPLTYVRLSCLTRSPRVPQHTGHVQKEGFDAPSSSYQAEEAPAQLHSS